MKKIALTVVLAGACAAPAFADSVIVDDRIIDGSLCTGLDCVNGESFGFDTIRLKENNTRIRFDDTSSSGSFPRTDWQLTANDSANGGRERFSIEDVSNAREIFTLTANAPDYSVYVDADGQVGFGTDAPARTLHVRAANTPSVRLEQGGGGGFDPTTWDVEANEQGLTIALNGEPQVTVDTAGNVTIAGSLTAGAPAETFPDYVFAPDYELMPLADLERFVTSERHLPGVPSASEVGRDGLDMTRLQVQLLKKVEELTLYTVRQQAQIEALQAELRAAR